MLEKREPDCHKSSKQRSYFASFCVCVQAYILCMRYFVTTCSYWASLLGLVNDYTVSESARLPPQLHCQFTVVVHIGAVCSMTAKLSADCLLFHLLVERINQRYYTSTIILEIFCAKIRDPVSQILKFLFVFGNFASRPRIWAPALCLLTTLGTSVPRIPCPPFPSLLVFFCKIPHVNRHGYWPDTLIRHRIKFYSVG